VIQYEPVLEAIMKRRSVRHYAATPVPEKHINMILDAARMAPTAGNQQPWKFVVTKDPQMIARLEEACVANAVSSYQKRANPSESQLNERMDQVKEYFNKCFSAPVYVTVLTDNQTQYPTYNHWDGPLAVANLMIAARALGYGTVFYTDSVPADVTKKVLKIPDNYERVCFTPIGIPKEWPDTPPKKSYDSFIVQNTF
jgi:nitroreductase